MKLVFCLFFVILVVVQAAERYTSKYDNVDIDAILKNQRILTNYIKCLMDEGSCTAEGRELRKYLPDAIKSGCTKCSPHQRQTAEKVINHLIKNRRADWDRLIAKYDPKGEYKRRYEAETGMKL